MYPLILFRKFIQLEASSGLALALSSLLALGLANSPIQSHYQAWLHTEFFLGTTLGSFSLAYLVNEGFMTVFFFLVSLEIKRELIEGQLNSRKKALLPLIGAIGGIVMPAIFYLILNNNQPHYQVGWAIPTATDIAFSLGVLSLLGSRLPMTLKIFLTALAILDDLMAIIIIALFYTKTLYIPFLGLAVICCLVLSYLNYQNVTRASPYIGVGLFLWFFTLKSGLHATLSGVLLGASIPLQAPKNARIGLLHNLEQRLHPWVAYAILPSFALVNAGLSLSDIHYAQLGNPLFLGILLGLFIGKQLGITLFCWLSVKQKIVRLPSTVGWRQLHAVAVLCGIGFTMSLFIGGLTFSKPPSIALVRLGVLTASLLSGGLGYFLLAKANPKKLTPVLIPVESLSTNQQNGQ